MAVTPWYKQFWPWVLIGLPASAVVAGIATLFIALDQPVSLVVDDYYKQGLAINQNRDRQRRAEAQGLGGEFALAADLGTASLSLNQALDVTQLNLRLVHPTRASEDRAGSLTVDMHGNLSGLIKPPSAGRWQIIVEPPDGEWRLTGDVFIDDPAQPLRVDLVPG